MSRVPARFERVAIISPGLLGGSVALACRERGLARSVVGIFRRPDSLARGIEKGVFDAGSLEIAAGVREADLVVIGAPVRATLEILPRLAPHLTPETLVTDLGSTKVAIAEAADRALPAGQFIGGHPMAGSHLKGLDAARADLFEGARWILTPTPRPDPRGWLKRLKRLEQFVQSLGATPVLLDPANHDRLVARVSHLPHLAACALVQVVTGVESEEDTDLSGRVKALDLAATGFRDTTRVAAGDPEMWTDICLTNRTAIEASLLALRKEIDLAVEAVRTGDETSLRSWLHSAAETRRSIDAASSPAEGAAQVPPGTSGNASRRLS